MNTIARAIPQQQFATRVQSKKILLKQVLQSVVLTIAVLFSAFTVVYVKDLYRRMFIHYQDLQAQQDQIYVDWGKLLLEQSTWSTQTRVQKIAAQRLQMDVPQANEINLIQN